jgi:hypothetical protein
VPFRVLGKAGGERLAITVGGAAAVDLEVAALRAAWLTALPQLLHR